MSEPVARVSPLVLLHAFVFAAGLLGALVGIVTGDAPWFFVAGPCLIVSGALVLLGTRITFTGPTGAVLRAALGPARVRGISLRAVVWILAGLLLCVWALKVARSERDDEQLLQEPLVRAIPAGSTSEGRRA